MSQKQILTEACEIETLLLNCNYIPFEKLRDKNIFVTGATGLVGSAFVKLLLVANEKMSLGLKVFALVRSIEKAEKMFSSNDSLILVQGDLDTFEDFDQEIDFVFHFASPTASKYFVEKPVETVKTAVGGTIKLLDFAVKKKVDGFVYLSSMEVYGENNTDDFLTEESILQTTCLKVRNCYPQSKLLCENLCVGYFNEYALPTKIVRLAQTFGIGVPATDNRVFSQFARSAIEGRDIVLVTAGATKQTYLYTLDSATAILAVMLLGESGQAYNAANEQTYCSVKEMAELVAEKIANGKVSVRINGGNAAAQAKYPATHKWRLSTKKLRDLGWEPVGDLEYMYKRLIDGINQ